jgi:hypothetical protein
MIQRNFILALASSLTLSACVAPIGPVEVTRFHAPDITRLGHGSIRVEPAAGQADDLEFRTYAAAVGRELTRVFVSIRERAAPPSATALWEGRAVFAVRADSPLAQAPLGSAKLAEALFKGFPGQSGETILVK